MVRLVQTMWDVETSRAKLIDLETRIIHVLEFDLHYTSPLTFVERFLRLYNLDTTGSDYEAMMIFNLTRLFCRTLLRSQAYLRLKPSQVASAALTLAVNICSSPLISKLGFQPLPDKPKLDSLVMDNVVSIEMNGISSKPRDPCPLAMWTPEILRLTSLSMETDLKPGYLALLKEVDAHIFGGKLRYETRLIPKNKSSSSPYSAMGRESFQWRSE